MNYGFEYRVIFNTVQDKEEAEYALDKEGVDYDYDSGDRMMLTQEGLDLLYTTDVDFDEV